MLFFKYIFHKYSSFIYALLKKGLCGMDHTFHEIFFMCYFTLCHFERLAGMQISYMILIHIECIVWYIPEFPPGLEKGKVLPVRKEHSFVS